VCGLGRGWRTAAHKTYILYIEKQRACHEQGYEKHCSHLDACGLGCGGALLHLAGHVLALLLHALNRHVLTHVLARLHAAAAAAAAAAFE
jgi:hypothetical protein